LFGELADTQAEARCLAHLGSAVVVAPELAGLLLEDDRRPVDEATAVQHAYAWLEHSRRLRAGQLPGHVAAYYLRLARTRTAHAMSPATGKGRTAPVAAGAGREPTAPPTGRGERDRGHTRDAVPDHHDVGAGPSDDGVAGAERAVGHRGNDLDPHDSLAEDMRGEDMPGEDMPGEELDLPARFRPERLARRAESLLRRVVTGLGRWFGS
jgi:hypothetical protein